MSLSSENQLQIKELELSSLIDTIRLISDNPSEADLYTIYRLSHQANTRIRKMALYVKDEDNWGFKTGFGTSYNYKNISLPEQLFESKVPNEILHTLQGFSEFDDVVATENQEKVLAYTFFGFTEDSSQGMPPDRDYLETLCQIIIVTLENKRMASRELERQSYHAQLEIAKEVQTLLFPKILPQTDKRYVAASYLPHHRVGGDYYDYIPLDNAGFLMCVADVSGKGIPAALLMSNFQAGLRLLAKQGRPLVEIVHELNGLVMNNAQGANFITAFFLEYDAQNECIRYINAGHNPPFAFIHQEWVRLEKGCTIVGGFDELPFMEEGILEDAKDFFVFCFTDGFIENYDEQDGDIFGEDRLLDFLKVHYLDNLPILHQKLIAKLEEFAGGNEYADDVTLLSCRVTS